LFSPLKLSDQILISKFPLPPNSKIKRHIEKEKGQLVFPRKPSFNTAFAIKADAHFQESLSRLELA
jgi:hypothetical protein